MSNVGLGLRTFGFHGHLVDLPSMYHSHHIFSHVLHTSDRRLFVLWLTIVDNINNKFMHTYCLLLLILCRAASSAALSHTGGF